MSRCPNCSCTICQCGVAEQDQLNATNVTNELLSELIDAVRQQTAAVKELTTLLAQEIERQRLVRSLVP